MPRYTGKHLPLRCLAVALIAALAWCGCLHADGLVGPAAGPGGDPPSPFWTPGDSPPAARALTLTLPTSGVAVDERGRLDPGGAVHLSIPIAYTLSQGQFAGTAFGLDSDDDWTGVYGFSGGLSTPLGGLSLTFAAGDRGGSDALTGHAQALLWPETSAWPAISAGVFDLADHYERSYYVTATKRLGKKHPKRVTLKASAPVWPPGDTTPSADSPDTWGKMTLASDTPSPEDLPAIDEITAPASEYPPMLDGMIGIEWEDAGQVRLDLPDGEFLLLGAKRVGRVLYVALGVPSNRYLNRGARADLYFRVPSPPDAQPADTLHRYTLRWDAKKGHMRQYRALGSAGEWTEDACAGDPGRPPRRFTAIAAALGDGAWHYPVFEFAIPLKGLGVEPGATGLGFLASVSLPAGQHDAVLKRDSEYRTRWPFGRGTYQSASHNDVFAQTPDMWGSVLREPDRYAKNSLVAPEIETSPTVDGVLGPEEWAAADRATTEIATGVQQTVYLQRTARALWLASVWDVSAGQWADQIVDVLLDPEGDEGLRPREDDRLLRITCQGDQVELRAFSWHYARGKWVPLEGLPFGAAARHEAIPTGSRNTVEARIPLERLALRQDSKDNVALRLALETTVTSMPARMVEPGAKVEVGPGKSTYVTAAWGSGVYEDRLMYGVSHPIGPFRGIAEYNGDAVNVGLTGTAPGRDDWRFTLGWSDPDDRSGALVLGTAVTTRF